MTQKFNYIDHYKIDAEEFDYFEERMGATKHDERRVHEYILSRIESKNNTILDVGSGSSWLAEKLDKTENKVTSLDISIKNVKMAKRKIDHEKHSQIVADSFNTPFKNNSFDIIVASEVIEHVVEPDKFIESLMELLKPSGKLIITTPYKEKLRFYLCIHCNKKTPVHAHLHSFDEKKLISYHPEKCDYRTFGNKFLIFFRTYILLQFLPFKIWRFIDLLFNYIYKRPVHILVEYYN